MTGLRFDLGSPWLAPYRADAEAVFREIDDGASVAEALNAQALRRGAPIVLSAGALRFVAPSARPSAEAYEAYIARTACVPTRENRHDLINGLVWLRWPAIKRRMNELQASQIAAHGIGAVRGPLRDALTLFDENGALLRGPSELLDLLRRRAWRALFVDERHLWRRANLTLVGHALIEKLVEPRKGITAHVLVASGADEASAMCLDALTAEQGGKPYLPLPVLGVPGWWAQNEEPSFYDDASVFRPA